jgi:hypothetical protein
MAFIPSAETHPISEALSVANNKLFEVVQLADAEGNIINPSSGNIVFDGEVSIGTEIEISNDSGNPIPTVEGLSIPPHDKIELSYTGENLTGVVYKDGTDTVATLTLAYTGSRLDSVTKS